MSTPPMNQLPPLGKSKDKFTPELRILVASLLSMAVILLWAKFFGPKPPVNPPQENRPAQVSTATPGNAAPPKTPNAAAAPAKISAATTPAVLPTADSQERTIVVENALYRVEFSNRGAVVKSWQLKNYKDDSKPQKTLDLVHPQAATETGGWPFALVFDDPQLGTLANSGLYKVSSDASSLEAPADLTFTWSDGHLQVTKKFHFDHSYTVNVETTVTNNGTHVMAGLAWLGGFGDLTVTNPIPVETVFVFYSEGGKLTTLAHKKLDGPEKWGNVWQGGKEFTGIEDRYFTAAFLPSLTDPAPLQTRYWKVFHNIKVDGKDQSEPVPEFATATSAENMALRVFVGPKDYDDLKAMHPPLHSLVQFGYLEFIADPLFHGLKWLHKYIPNYGWAIVVLTLVINMVLFPLRISSYKTTLKMQRVAPEIKQIQERYKKYKMNDPRKAEMNKEVMAIYSREGINPIGGCFQMFLQMPIWFGLNRALSYAIELRHTQWLWITDLASKDPYYILPVLVGITMYLVSKMTPMTTTDPQQAQMMKIMPLTFSVMFVVFPFSSGLALYILTSSLVGIAQQWYLNRSHPLPAPAKPTRAKN
ncbi:MAG TPA: membrane protein insertase YidC [Candidatus Acidoferrales bacterium]|nr:membrane protein insertase YidC [Candidatus Acidoferrales bacterium]